MSVSAILAQTTYEYNDTAAGAGGGVLLLIYFGVLIAALAGLWKVFEKAGQPGWAAIIPFYNSYILLKIAGRPGWWLLFYIIPLVNLVVSAIVALDIARAFGKSELFGILGLWMFVFVGYPMLGFGEDKYHGAKPTEL